MTKVSTTIPSQREDVAKALEIIAMNTMCTREAISVTAKSIIAWIISSIVVVIAVVVINVNPVDSKYGPTGLHLVCLAAIILVGLFAVIYPLVLISGLNRTINHVRESEERNLGGNKNEE